MSVVVCDCSSMRESALREYEKAPEKFKGGDTNDVKIDRAKTSQQLTRNNALRRALALVKQNSSKTDSAEIVWKKTGSKDREVIVDGITAFRQTIDDSQGLFLAPFSALVLEAPER